MLPVLLLGCSDPQGPADDREVIVLFVGNSLTYANDLPKIVQGIADAVGLSVTHEMVTR